jgi:hypothetical protein
MHIVGQMISSKGVKRFGLLLVVFLVQVVVQFGKLFEKGGQGIGFQ